MRKVMRLTLAALVLVVGAGRGDEKDDEKKEKEEKLAARKKAAEANWDAVEAGPWAMTETKHLIVIVPKAMEKRLKDVAGLLEKAHDQARGALAFEKDKEPLPSKMIVYLLPGREQFRAFVRRVEKRRLESAEAGSFAAADEKLHAAASPGHAAGDLSLEGQAVAQVAAVLLVRKAGVKVPVSAWLVEGFGRATWYRVASRDKVTLDDRRAAARLSSKHGAKDIYDGLVEAAEATPLRGSLADYLAYGPGAAKFPALLKGFEPEENVESKTTGQALQSAGISWDRLDRSWKTWALTVR